jgi:hypothetical protein
MAKATKAFTIKEKDLAAALEISPEKLQQIIDFFDSDPNDKWELKENDHFIFINKKWNERIFSHQGAFAIAKYMDEKEKKNLWDIFKEFITRHKEKIRHAFVRQKVQDNCTSLTTRNNRHFLSKKDIVAILSTSYPRFKQVVDEIQKSNEPLKIGEDFDDIDGVRYYSLSGLDRLSRKLSADLKDIARREWCSAVEVVGSKTLKMLVAARDKEIQEREKRIKAAMDAAKRRDKNCCQITGEKPTKSSKINMVAHHIFSQKEYPHLATIPDNLITLTETVHKDFHAWNGGTQKPCTIDNLIQFANELYPDREEANINLNLIKKTLSKLV